MSEVELECAVYGEGTVFPVKIARDAKVSALQEAIAVRYKIVSNRVEVFPATLTLYVAKKKEGDETKWLKDDRHVKDFLQGKISTEYEEMRPSWRLNKDELLGPNFKPKDEEIHVLVELPVDKKAPHRGFVGSPLTYADGINPTSPHFNRDDLLASMYQWITGDQGKNRYLLLNSPAASGKTSLLNLFQHKYPQLNSIYVSLKQDSDPYISLLRFGLDIKSRTCQYDQVIYMLDDAQYRYDSPDFWAVLIKDVSWMFGAGVRFIISATHVISTQQQSSPADFSLLTTITREDLLLSDEQSMLLLNSEAPIGLQTYMQSFSVLKTTIIDHCNGLIGALCKSVFFYAEQLRTHEATETECLRLYFSKRLLAQVDRCFGIIQQSFVPPSVSHALLKCVLGERIHTIVNMDPDLSNVFASFAKAGILVVDAQNYYVFSSLLAKRYFTHRYFPDRADHNPSNLRQLVLSAIASMSASALGSSVSNAKDFPKETTFQHLFMQGLLNSTTINTAICSELSRSFATNEKVKGEIDFFVDGSCMWGIELVRNGDDIGGHMKRFSSGGKYAGLQAADYVVLDFRKGVANVRQDPHRVTAFFEIDSEENTCFDHVVVKYGDDEKACNVDLKP